MGYVRYEVRLTLQNGDPASGSQISAENESAWLGQSKYFEGTTGHDGIYVWDSMATGINNDHYTFYARYSNWESEFIARWRERLRPSIGNCKKEITLRRKFMDEIANLEMPVEAVEFFKGDPYGEQVLQGAAELKKTMEMNLPLSSVAVSTMLLEGAIKALLNVKGKLDKEKSHFTFGKFINNLEVTETLGLNEGLLEKLKGINKFRRSALHYKGAITFMDEARLILSEFFEIAKTFLKNEGGPPKGE